MSEANDLRPLVSIVTPSFNQAAFLEQTILSVIQQDYSPIEYLIIDGGSTDGSQEIIRRYENHLGYWESQADDGQANAINKGLRRAKGEILGWLNSDDVLAPGAIRRAMKVFRQFPEIDVVYGHLERIDETGCVIDTPVLPKDKVVFDKKHVIGECLVNQPGALWRRKAMEKVGLLDESLHFVMDYEYWIRMALSGARFFRLEEKVAFFRLSPESKTVSQSSRMAEEQMAVLESLLERSDLPERLGQTHEQILLKARTARSTIALHAFYGTVKQASWSSSIQWLGMALNNDPRTIFQRRWLNLLSAGVKRRFFRKRISDPRV